MRRIIFFVIGVLIGYICFPSLCEGLEINGLNKLDIRLASEGKEFLENRFRLNLDLDLVRLGFRYDIAHPSDYNPITNTDSIFEGITKKYISLIKGAFALELGNFTTSFGNGIILSLFEDDNLKLDRDLEGVHISYTGNYLNLNGLSGRASWDNMTHLKGIELKGKSRYVNIAGAYIKYGGETETGELNSSQFEANLLNITLRGEYAEKKPFGRARGFARYICGTLDLFEQTLSVEWKSYSRFIFRTPRAQYNNPPWAIREPDWYLLAYKPYIIDPADEEGFRCILDLSFPNELKFELDFARSRNSTKTRKLSELFIKAEKFIENHNFQSLFDIRETTISTSYIGILALDLIISKEIFLYFELQGERIKDAKKNNLYSLAELNYKATYGVGLSYARIEKESGVSFELSVTSSGHTLKLTLGKSLGGAICSAGVCRYISPFKGAELSVISTF